MDLKDQYDKLLRYCYIKTNDKYLAEDIVQETYLKFWSAHSYKDTGKEMSYLYTIARNLCMDEFRKQKLENIEDHENELSNLTYDNNGDIQIKELEKCLDKLPRELKEILVLRYTNEMSVTDIAKIMGISRFSIHRKINKALGLLKKEIEGME